MSTSLTSGRAGIRALGAEDQHQVGRLDVAVDHAVLDGVLQAQGGLANDVAGQRHGQRAGLFDHALQRDTRHVFHGQEVGLAVLVEFIDGDDIGVGQPGRGLGFAAKAADHLGVGLPFRADDLEGDVPVGGQMTGAVDNAHAAATELFFDAITLDDGQAGFLAIPGDAWRHDGGAGIAQDEGGRRQDAVLARTAHGTDERRRPGAGTGFGKRLPLVAIGTAQQARHDTTPGLPGPKCFMLPARRGRAKGIRKAPREFTLAARPDSAACGWVCAGLGLREHRRRRGGLF